MLVMMLGVFNLNSTNVAQSKGFKQYGCEVIEYDYRHRAGVIGARKRDVEIVDICKNRRPDILFISKCNEVNVSVVRDCNNYTKTVLWYMDPLNVNYSVEFKQKMQIAHRVVCALTEPYLESKKLCRHPERVHFVHECFDDEVNYPIDIPYVHDVSFIGNLRNDRTRFHRLHPFCVITRAYHKDHSVAVSQSKINLNFTEGGTSDRTYKVLASKGFLLTQPWPNMENDFVVGEDLDVFSDIDEMKAKIDFYLNHEDRRKEIAEHGYRTVQKFNQLNFAKNIIEITK